MEDRLDSDFDFCAVLNRPRDLCQPTDEVALPEHALLVAVVLGEPLRQRAVEVDIVQR